MIFRWGLYSCILLMYLYPHMVEGIKLKPVDEFSAPTGLTFTEDYRTNLPLPL